MGGDSRLSVREVCSANLVVTRRLELTRLGECDTAFLLLPLPIILYCIESPAGQPLGEVGVNHSRRTWFCDLARAEPLNAVAPNEPGTTYADTCPTRTSVKRTGPASIPESGATRKDNVMQPPASTRPSARLGVECDSRYIILVGSQLMLRGRKR